MTFPKKGSFLELEEFGTTINHAVSYTGKPAKNID